MFWKISVKIVAILNAILKFSCYLTVICASRFLFDEKSLYPSSQILPRKKSLGVRSGEYNEIQLIQNDQSIWIAIHKFYHHITDIRLFSFLQKHWHELAQMTVKQQLSIQNGYNFRKYHSKHVVPEWIWRVMLLLYWGSNLFKRPSYLLKLNSLNILNVKIYWANSCRSELLKGCNIA